MPQSKRIRQRGRKPQASHADQQAGGTQWAGDYIEMDPQRSPRLYSLRRELPQLISSSHELQISKLDEAIAEIYPYRGRTEQLEALRVLIFEQRDLMLVAKTSFGKSMIMQALPCLVPYVRPVHVWGKTISAELIEDIRTGSYTHILISPELLVSDKLHKVLIDPIFHSHVALVVVDEVHLLADWGETFRIAYAQLFKVRSVLVDKPWFACTATLDPSTFQTVCKLAGFKRRVMTAPEKKDFRALYFTITAAPVYSHTVSNSNRGEGEQLRSHLISAQRTYRQQFDQLQLIPKTIIFFDSKEWIAACRNTIRSWLIHRGYDAAVAREVVQSYHATLADIDKDRLYAEYARPTSRIRIFVASDAVAHGADVPDIYRSIQYGMPRHKSCNMLTQRFGWAGRGEGLSGEAIFMVESRWRGPCDELGGSKHIQPQRIGDLRASALRNDIRGRQNTETADIAGDASSEELIVPTLRPKKRLTNAQLRGKLPFTTLWRPTVYC